MVNIYGCIFYTNFEIKFLIFMLTLNNILKEIKDVPVNRLEELYQIVHSFTPATNKHTDNNRTRILSFAGSFSDMADKEYSDYLAQTKKVRSRLFERNINL